MEQIIKIAIVFCGIVLIGTLVTFGWKPFNDYLYIRKLDKYQKSPEYIEKAERNETRSYKIPAIQDSSFAQDSIRNDSIMKKYR